VYSDKGSQGNKMKVITKKQHNTINLRPTPYPDWDSFIIWGQNFLQNIQGTQNVTHNSGADLHMISFHFMSLRFSLNYESYSDSIWIESDESAAATLIHELSALIQQCGNIH
jgi:hypothetical protein